VNPVTATHFCQFVRASPVATWRVDESTLPEVYEFLRSSTMRLEPTGIDSAIIVHSASVPARVA